MSDIDLKGAIVKYLKNDWEKEQKDLKELRNCIALKAVPEAFGHSGKVGVSERTLTNYIRILTNQPDSKKGKASRLYLSSLVENNLEVDYNELLKIEDVAKLHYIDHTFLENSAEVSNGELNYGEADSSYEGFVKLCDGKVTISKRFSNKELLELIPRMRSFEASLYGLLISGHTELKIDKLKPNLELYTELIQEGIILRAKEKMMKEFNTQTDKIRKYGTGINYKILFDEGEAENNSITLNKYSSTVETMLDKIL